MNIKMLKAALTGLLFSISGFANAGLITITGYDIENANTSGTGGWGHTFDGTITPTSGSKANYLGGSGTLNNGIIETSAGTTQLFNYPSESSPIITLYLDGFYSLNNLLISGGNFGDNSIPGELIGLDVTINSISESFVTASQGMVVLSGLADDFVNFSGSSLAGLVTNKLILSNFDSNWSSYNTFSIAEITLDGTREAEPSQVPEPSTLVIFALGIMGLASRRFKKQ